MIVFRARIPLIPARRSQVLCSLRRILGQTRALPGCVSCRACIDIEDDNLLLLIAEWADTQSLRTHVRADNFRVVLSALDCASDQPEVRFDTVADTKGMDFIMACRQGPEAEGSPRDPAAEAADGHAGSALPP